MNMQGPASSQLALTRRYTGRESGRNCSLDLQQPDLRRLAQGKQLQAIRGNRSHTRNEMNRPRSDMQKHSKPTSLINGFFAQTFPSRDSAMRWFRDADRKEVAVHQAGECVAIWTKGVRGGVKVKRIAA